MPILIRRVLHGLWAAWLAWARLLGRFNTWLILTLLYWIVLPLFALYRLADPLGLRRQQQHSYWQARKPIEATIARFLLRY